MYWERTIFFNEQTENSGEVRFIHHHDRGEASIATITVRRPDRGYYFGCEIKEQSPIQNQPHWTTEIIVKCPKCGEILKEEDISGTEDIPGTMFTIGAKPRGLRTFDDSETMIPNPPHINEEKDRTELNRSQEILTLVDFWLRCTVTLTGILRGERNLHNSLLWGNTTVELQQILQNTIDKLKVLEKII